MSPKNVTGASDLSRPALSAREAELMLARWCLSSSKSVGLPWVPGHVKICDSETSRKTRSALEEAEPRQAALVKTGSFRRLGRSG